MERQPACGAWDTVRTRRTATICSSTPTVHAISLPPRPQGWSAQPSTRSVPERAAPEVNGRSRFQSGGPTAFSAGTPPRLPQEIPSWAHGRYGHSRAGHARQFLLYWALHVRVYVRAEQRVKSNEVVISRPDISVMALYRRGETIDDTTVVLVREFRSPASTSDGLVHELPGGSAPGEAEASIKLSTKPRKKQGSLSTCTGSGPMVTASSQPPYPHIMPTYSQPKSPATNSPGCKPPSLRRMGLATQKNLDRDHYLREIRRNRLVDWATLGMITQALLTSHLL